MTCATSTTLGAYVDGRRTRTDCCRVSLVLPACPANVTVTSVSAGQAALRPSCAGATRLPSSSAQQAGQTIRSGATTSRYTPVHHESRPSGRSHPAGQDAPRRRTIVQTGTVQPCGPRQRLRRSGSVNAWNTRSRGASRMRIILSSRSLACVAALVLALLPARLLLLVHVRAASRVRYPARCSECRHYVGGPSLTDRISMVLTRATAPRAAMAIASSRSVTSMSM